MHTVSQVSAFHHNSAGGAQQRTCRSCAARLTAWKASFARACPHLSGWISRLSRQYRFFTSAGVAANPTPSTAYGSRSGGASPICGNAVSSTLQPHPAEAAHWATQLQNTTHSCCSSR